MIELNFLEANLSKSKIITKDEILVRELIELCSNYKSMTSNIKGLLEEVKKFKAHHFIKANEEINKVDNKVIKDMINMQYIIDNIEALKQIAIFDDEEIY